MRRSALLASTPAGAIAAFLPPVDPPDEVRSDRALGWALLRSGRLPLTTVVPPGRPVVRTGR